jgi:uncharacterized protein YpuA (DUF1002 family)
MDRHYEVLGIDPNSSVETVKETYLELAKKTHPDRGADPARFQEIHDAYSAIVECQEKPPASEPVLEKIVSNISNNLVNLTDQEKSSLIDIVQQAAEGNADTFDLTTGIGKSGVDILKRKMIEFMPNTCETIDFFSEVLFQVKIFDA